MVLHLHHVQQVYNIIMKHNKLKSFVAAIASVGLLAACTTNAVTTETSTKTPAEYVNPYMGNISHLLVPTFPTVHLPNSMLRVYPERGDFTNVRIYGLPLIVTSHRGSSAFNLSPHQGDANGLHDVISYSYDQEKIHPYRYQVYLDQEEIEVDFAPSHQSAVYNISFSGNKPAYLVFNSRNGAMKTSENHVSGYQYVDDKTKVYIYAETDQTPVKRGMVKDGNVQYGDQTIEGDHVVLAYGDKVKDVHVRYGVSFISEEQAQKNLAREITSYDVDVVAKKAMSVWNEALGKIQVEGNTEDNKTIFYTSLYRYYERPVCLSEDTSKEKFSMGRSTVGMLQEYTDSSLSS